MTGAALASDGLRALAWLALLGVGVGACVGLHRLGLATTYVRDLLHVGAGVWVLGWSGWRTPLVPIGITVAAAAATALLPLAARGGGVWRRFRDAVSDGDERWGGLVLYTVSFAVFTGAGLLGPRWPAAAALAALALGDGLGGAVGRRFGRHRYTMPGAKRKSVEGTLTVAVASGLGAAALAWWFGVRLPATAFVLAGLTAAAVEAVAMRGSDNLLVPLAVYTVLWTCT